MMISVVLPSYNEAENLEKIIPQIKAALKDLQYEILIIDTVTPMDNTKEICEKQNVAYVPRRNANFYGDAVRTGIEEAHGDYIVFMDADGSHDPKEISKFYEHMRNGNCDLVIGSRYIKGGYTDNPFILVFMSWVLNVTYRVIFSLNVKDVSDSFRMYKTEQIKRISLSCQNFDIVEELLIKLNVYFSPLRIKELPISFNKRMAGESKRDLIKFVKSYVKTIRRLLKLKASAEKGLDKKNM